MIITILAAVLAVALVVMGSLREERINNSICG